MSEYDESKKGKKSNESTESNVQRLINAGVLNDNPQFSSSDLEQLNSLSTEEIDSVISISDTLDVDFYDRNSANFAKTNFI